MDNVRWDLKTMVDWIDWDEFEATARELKPSSIQDRRDMRDPNDFGSILLSCMGAWGRPMGKTASEVADLLSTTSAGQVQ